ncbi:MAG: UbiA family prenyltransferase [Planctomycetota bacterium]
MDSPAGEHRRHDPSSRWFRLWLYQAERFPLYQHGPVVAAFSYSALCFSRLLRTGEGEAFSMPGPIAGSVAFVVCLGVFFQLRVADEFKDLKEDTQHRPYRPVPRGLVSLAELRALAYAVALLQLVLVGFYAPPLLVLLGFVWVYLLLMTHEFFVGSWLRGRPVAYTTSHMMIMPLIDLFATGCDWAVADERPPLVGLGLFLSASYASGLIIEIGRKIRAPADEEHGVETYSAMWSAGGACLVWLALIACGGTIAVIAASEIGFTRPMLAVAVVMAASAVLTARGFLRAKSPGSGRRVEAVAGIWVIVTYLSLGIVPGVLRAWG